MLRGESPDGPIIVFDGVCVLCSSFAQFVLRHDPEGVFRLAAMQGDVGAALARRFGIDPVDPPTILVVNGDAASRDSDAIVDVLSRLGRPWRALALIRFAPRPLRDAVYRLVARNRYRAFGRRETCWTPKAEWASRIL